MEGSGAKIAAGPRWMPTGAPAGVLVELVMAGGGSGVGSGGGAGTSMWIGVNVETSEIGAVDGGATGGVEASVRGAVGGARGELGDAAVGDGQAGGANTSQPGAVPGSIASDANAPGSMVSTSFDIQGVLRSIQTRS